MGMMWIAAVLGAGTGAGAWWIVSTLRPNVTRPDTEARANEDGPDRAGVWLRAHRWRLAGTVAVGVVAGVVTGWPVAAVAAAGLWWAGPGLFGRDRQHQVQLERIEAVAAWTESLRDTVAAASGLEQALIASATHAPAAIRDDTARLADDVRAGRTVPGLRAFADNLHDETCDLVVVALIMASQRQAGHLASLLSTLADTARSQAAMRMRVAAARARIRTSTRVITAVTLAMVAGLIILNAGFLAPYSTVGGQFVLLVVAGLFGVGLWWLQRLARIPVPARLIDTGSPS